MCLECVPICKRYSQFLNCNACGTAHASRDRIESNAPPGRHNPHFFGRTPAHNMTKNQTAPSSMPRDRALLPKGRRPGPMSITRVMAILDYLSNRQSPVPLSDLSRDLGAPKASLLAILSELVALGFLRREHDGRYFLGGNAYRLAARMTASGSINQSVRTTLANVGRELEATVSLGYLDVPSRTLVYADRHGEYSAVRYLVKYGPATNIQSRATGKMLVSLQPENTWADWFGPEPYAKVGSRSHTTFSTLRLDLVRARKSLVAFTRSEHYEGISGCAVPVFGAEGEAVSGIGLLMVTESLERNKDRVLQVIKHAADLLSEEFNFQNISAETISSYL